MDFEEPIVEFTDDVDLEKFLESRCNIFTKSPAIVKAKNFSPDVHSYKGDLKFIESKLSLSEINPGCYIVYHEKSGNQKEKKSYSCNFSSLNETHTEKQFWNDLKENPSKKITYGTDIDLSNHKKFPISPNWDLCNLKTTLTDNIPSACDISGITKPFAYYGYPKSYFPIHREDYDLCSINYLLQGAPKIWYAFLEKDNDRIIQYMEKIFIEEFEKCKEAYRHKDFFIDPSHLKMIFPDLKIFRIIQQPGDYVITGPGVYHQGFNQGFNLAYAVNIGISIWLPLLQKVKPCLCLGQGWRLKIEETKKIFTNAEEIIPSFDVTSQHFAKFRAPFFLLITYHSDILNIQRLIKFYAANTALGRPYLAVLDEPFQNVIIDGQVFALRKYHVKIAHKERKTVPVTSINQLIRNNSEYKNLLKSCMIIPFYLRSYKSQLENLISRKSIWVPIEYFKINSLTLYQIFQTHKWKINQDILEILACRKEDNNNDNNDNNDDDDNDEEDDDDDERAIETKQNILLNQPFLQQQFISVAFAELKEEACYQMALVDNDGIVRINSTISKTLTGRQSFWKQNLSKFFLSNTLKIIVPNQKLFHEIFLNEMKPFFVGLEILELSSQADVDDITTVNKKTIEILKARKEFQYINFENLNLEGLARFQRYYFLPTQKYSPSDLSYFEECSLNPQRAKKYVLSCFQSSQAWIYCIVDHNERCLFMRRSEDWRENKQEKSLIKNIQVFVNDYLLQADDRLYHFLKPKSFGFAETCPKIIYLGEYFKPKYENSNQEIHLIANARQFLRKIID